jgi:uncharacterized protein involved in exopolysaccharide biosynthesis/Mrp family chromosome partitioning ATPase
MSSRDVMDESVEYRARLIADALRRQTWIVVAAALLGALLGYGASVARPGSYVASASALITALPGNPYAPGVSGQDGAVAVETESRVASSDSVSALVAKELGEDPDKLSKGVSVSVPPSTSIIQVSFASSDPEFARRAAQAYVDNFLAYRADRAGSVNAAQISALTHQRDTVQTQRDDTKTLAAGDPDYNSLIKRYNSQIVALNAQIGALQAQEPDPGRVISPATTPKKTSGLPPLLYIVGGLLFGLVGGVALALARQRRDDRVLHVDEIEAAGLPVFATWGGSQARSAEATRLIRARVLGVTSTPAVIVVGSSRPRSGTSRVAAQLAESLANVGRTVVFADLEGDPARGAGESVPFGFTDLLTGRRSDMADLLVELDPNLTLLPKGRASLTSAVEFLDADRMREVIEDLPHHAEYVLVNVPALTDSIGETMMEIADLSVVTVALAHSTRHELAVVRSRGDGRIGACVVVRGRRRLRKATRRSRKEGSSQVARRGDSLTVIGDEEISA